MSPVIGIVLRVEYPGNTNNLIVNEEYRNAIIKNGAIPLGILPPQTINYTSVKYNDQEELTKKEKNIIIRQIKMCDGVLLPGGFKINKYDRFILEYLIKEDIPTLGICLGMQVMSNYKRENLWNERNSSLINHKGEGYMHSVTLDKSSKLYSIIKKEKFEVTSRHNYHVLPNDYYDIVGVSSDNYIEAIEMKNKNFHIGIQWHPESIADDISKKIFNSFIKACSLNDKKEKSDKK